MSNTKNKMTRLLGLGAASIFVIATVALGTRAQDTSTTTVRHGSSSYDTKVKNAEVVYVEGNDLVLKLEDGKIEHLVVPDADRFNIDGNNVTVHDLVPGTKLTQTITTSTTPRYVNTVRTIEGKVWHVTAPTSVIVSLPDGTNQVYKVPDHAKFTIEGEPKTVFELKKGMNFKATIITDDTHTVIAENRSVVGQAPPPATPPVVGVLLFSPPAPAPVLTASAEEPAATLPQTGSLLPLLGVLGALAISMSLGLGLVRRTVKA